MLISLLLKNGGIWHIMLGSDVSYVMVTGNWGGFQIFNSKMFLKVPYYAPFHKM